jgi:TonB family protein
LNVEVTGPIARKQVAAQQHILSPRQFDPPTTDQIQQADKPKPAPRDVFHPNLADLRITPSEVHNDPIDALQIPLSSTTSTTPLQSRQAPQPNGNAEASQNQQSASRQSSDADLLNAYISALARRVDSHLIYPNEVKKKRLQGVTQVSFVVTDAGEIKPGSLEIKRSSGSALLDSNAEKTILALVPFQKPPREMTIALEIEFTVDF